MCQVKCIDTTGHEMSCPLQLTEKADAQQQMIKVESFE